MVGQSTMMKYPYTVMGKFVRFPWKYHWQNARYFRYATYALIVSYPLFYKIHKAVNSPENIREWTEIREKRKHSHFDPVHE